MFSPLDPHVLFYAANVLFKTTDGGHSWQTISGDLTRPHPGIPASLGSMAAKDPGADKQRGVIYSLAPSFKNIDTIWAGTDEGLIWITRDGGKNWKDITPPALTPWSKVTQLEASHFDDQSAYASVSRFRVDDLTPYIYRTHDGGKTWQLITAGLPDDAPIDTVREDPVRKGLLFAGSETSVWVSFDDGDHWQSLQLNLPHTSMRDLWIHGERPDRRHAWPLVLDSRRHHSLRQIDEKTVAQSSAWLCSPRRHSACGRDTNTDTPLPPDEPLAENPPDGAVVDYFLAQAASGDRDARNPGCRRQAGAPLLEHRHAGNDRSRSEDAGHSAVLGAPAADSARHRGHAPLGLGSARRAAGISAARVSDRGRPARYAPASAGPPRAARRVHREAHGGWQSLHRAAHRQDGPPREDDRGRPRRNSLRWKLNWLRC